MLRCALLLLILPVLAVPLRAQVPDTLQQHYRVYEASGAPATLAAVLDAMAGADVVLLGETHDDPTTHALQIRLLEQAYDRYGGADGRPVVLSLEMFERDVQPVLDEYLQGLITERHFLAAARPWQNYDVDYRPMLEFARAQGLAVLAANAPRRYINRVTRLGPEALSTLPEAARSALAPLPYAPASSAYQARWDHLMSASMPSTSSAVTDPTAGAAPADTSAQPPQHGQMGYMLDAQSLWDATMAFSIAEHLLQRPDALVLHLVGGFHVEADSGLPDHLRRYRPGTRILVVAMRPHTDVVDFDAELFEGLGTFVVLTNDSLPRTHQRTGL